MARGKANASSSSSRPLPSRGGALLIGAAVIAACFGIRAYWPAAQVDAGPPAGKPAAKAPSGKTPPGKDASSASDKGGAAVASDGPAPAGKKGGGVQVAAVVNGREISRQELAAKCVRLFGKEVLESAVNKTIIDQECKARGIVIKREDVEKEIERLAMRFNMPKERWLTMLEHERGIKPAQYITDIIWPTLALRALSKDTIQATDEEIDRLFQSKFGPSVQVRLIVANSRDKAEKLRKAAAANPQDFAKLAKSDSDEPGSASAGGLVQPIRRYVGDPKIVDAAFALKEDGLSPVIPVGQQFYILKCEKHIPARKDVKLTPDVKNQLAQEISDRNERESGSRVFASLQKKAGVQNIFNDPVKSKQYPGVAAIVNDEQIPMARLGDMCIDRHGADVLEGIIVRRLIEQSLGAAQREVTDKDIDEEIIRAASAAGIEGQDDQEILNKWLTIVEEEQGLSEQTYVDEVVWPSVALKFLVGGSVEVSDDDLKKGFEANYGPRARCQAIVMANQRKALEVFEQARQSPSEKKFGDLAEQYSIDPQSAQLRGQIPPIQKHGGQPALEKAAFGLAPGELSEIVQVNENFILLRGLGLTEASNIKLEEVRDILYEDIHEKKIRVAMSKKLEDLKQSAQIDNYVAGSIQTPKSKDKDKAAAKGSAPGPKTRDGAVRPATATELFPNKDKRR